MPVESSRPAAGGASAAAAAHAPPASGTGAVHLPHGPSSVPAARHALVTSLTACRAERDVVDDAAVVVSELLGNAVRHAGPTRTGCVVLRWSVEGSSVTVEVVDGGGKGAGPTASDADASATSGRGLRIVEALCTRWGSRTDAAGQRTVWATFEVVRALPRSA